MRKITSIKYSIDDKNETLQFFSKEIRIENSQGLPFEIRWMNEKNEVTLDFNNYYDENGDLKKYTQYYPDSNYKKIWEIERDEQNRISKINFRTSNNPPEFNYGETIYNYAENGKSVEITEQELGEEPNRMKKLFDDDGNLIRGIEYDEDMEIVNELRFKYNSKGEKEVMDYFGRGGKDLQSRSYYNPNGEILKKEYFGTEKIIQEFIYKYNLDKLWIERKTLKNGKLQFLEKREIKNEQDSE